MTRIVAVIALGAFLTAPAGAAAQGTRDAWGGLAFVTVGAGVQTESPAFGYNFSTAVFDETARAGLDTPGKNGLSFEVGGGIRLVQNLGFGVTYARYSKERTATLSASIPSPIYFNDESTALRQFPLTRTENAVHFQMIYRIPLVERLQMGVFGGPSFFHCTDDSVERFQLEGEISPAEDWSVNFSEVTQTVHKDDAWGYNAGADVTYMFTRRLGFGVSMRYSRAKHETDNPLSDTADLLNDGAWGGHQGTSRFTMKHGGLQWTGGISIRF